jgi:hypothetical protein
MKKISPEEKQLLLDQYHQWSDFDGVFVLSPDWSVGVPLWPQSGAIDELIPETLQEKLKAWQNIFDCSYRWSDDSRREGWLSKVAGDEWKQAVPELVAELTSALEGKARLIVDLWPITHGEENQELQDYRQAFSARLRRDWKSRRMESGEGFGRTVSGTESYDHHCFH